MAFLLRRKEDGLYRLKTHRWHEVPWTDDTNKAQVFKTPAGCKNAMQSYLYEEVMLGTFRATWEGRKVEGTKLVYHPEWFDEKFEVVPVEISVVCP